MRFHDEFIPTHLVYYSGLHCNVVVTSLSGFEVWRMFGEYSAIDTLCCHVQCNGDVHSINVVRVLIVC